jgi:hypothetical protein
MAMARVWSCLWGLIAARGMHVLPSRRFERRTFDRSGYEVRLCALRRIGA